MLEGGGKRLGIESSKGTGGVLYLTWEKTGRVINQQFPRERAEAVVPEASRSRKTTAPLLCRALNGFVDVPCARKFSVEAMPERNRTRTGRGLEGHARVSSRRQGDQMPVSF